MALDGYTKHCKLCLQVLLTDEKEICIGCWEANTPDGKTALTAHAEFNEGKVVGVKEGILNRLHCFCGYSHCGKSSVLPNSILASTVLKAIDLDGKLQASERGED